MNLLDDVEEYKPPSKAKLTKQATNLVGRRKTRRGKKKKPNHVIVNKKLKDKALKEYNKQKQQRWQQYQDFRLLIEKE